MTNKLYPFQQEMVDKFTSVPTALCADDMGLGKTVEGICLDLKKRERYLTEWQTKYKGKGMTLIVSRLSVLGAWREHYAKWAPHLKVLVIDNKNRAPFVASFLKGAHDVYIMHWEALRLIPELNRVFWFHVIGDEIQAIKNRKAIQTVKFKHLPTAHKLGLSGTPADNRPDDFWSVGNWLWPRIFSSYNTFFDRHVIYKQHTKDYCTAQGCDKYHKANYKEILGTAHIEEIQAAIGPYYIRRLKEEVLPELPDKYYTELFVDLTPPQRRAYEEMRRNMLAWVGEHENEHLAAPVVIAQLIRLNQFACAYGRMESVVKRYKDCQDCFDQGLPTCAGHVLDVLKLTEPSSKLDLCMQLILDNPNKQIGVFSNSKQVINMLARRLEDANVATAVLTGDTKQGDRDKIISGFQAGETQIFASTIKAGGVGLTLTAADTCIFLDRHWSPSANRQAEDRFHRIGQKNAVQIIDLIARDTADLGRLTKVELKWSWIKELLGDKNFQARVIGGESDT